MKKTLLSLAFIANVACSQSFIRTHTIVSDNSTFPTPANVEWMQGESVRFEITAKSGNFYIPLSNGVAPVLKMWSGNVITQLYAQKTGTIYSAGSGKLYVDLLANEANISPSGAYNYAVGVYDGTQYMGVVAQGRATVRAHPFGSSVGYVGAFNAFPYVPTNDANYLGGITGAVAGANVSIARTGRTVYISATAGGGGSGTFTNLQWGTNNNTAQALIRAESNIVFRSAGGTNYAALAGNLAGDFTFNGAINANDNIEIANTKHLRFQDGGGTNTVHLEAVKGRLIISGAVDIVSGQAVPATINGSVIATGTPLYVQSETNAEARLSSNFWAAADSTTNYVRLTGDTLTGPLNGQTAASFFPTMRAWNSLPFVGLTDGSSLNGLRVHAHPAIGGVGVLTLGAFIPNAVGPIQQFSWAGEIDSVNTVGEFWRLRHVGQDGATQTVMRMVADSALGHSAQIIISNGVFNGDGAGITNLPASAVNTNLAVVEPHWFRTQAGATSIWSYADLGSGDMLTVATATNIESYPLIFQTAQAGSLQQLTREGALVSPIDATNIIVDLKSNATNGSAVVSIYSGTASGIRTQSLVGAAGTVYSLNVPIALKAWQRIGVSVGASLQNTNAATAVGQLGAGYWRAQQ